MTRIKDALSCGQGKGGGAQRVKSGFGAKNYPLIRKVGFAFGENIKMISMLRETRPTANKSQFLEYSPHLTG